MKALREEFVQASRESDNFSALCREFGITRKTGYKWLERAANGQGLEDVSRRPHHVGCRTALEIEEQIIRLRAENPGWGAKTLKRVLENEGADNIPCVKTVNNILKRYGCIIPEESVKHKAYIRFEKQRCNEMWQTDFKGEFLTGDGRYCYPLNIFDDHSRFLIKTASFSSTENVVLPTFKAAFTEYGIPDSVLSDNGAQFAGFRKGFTQFEKWLMDHDVLPIHGRIKHPQTQGKIERFHRTMKHEFLKYNRFENVSEANAALQQWRNKYNYVRPHEALGMKCPADVYSASDRQYHDKVSTFEYGGQHHVIKVNSWGYVRFAGWQIYLSETMIDHYIEFRHSLDGTSFFACYRNFKIAQFDTKNGSLIRRFIARL